MRNHNLMCCLGFHDWDKWSDPIEAMHWDDINSLGQKVNEQQCYIQYRRCLICNRQDKRITL